MLKDQFLAYLGDDADIIAVAAFHNQTPFRMLTDRFDLLILVVTAHTGEDKSLYHYIKDGYRVQEIRLPRQNLEKWVHRSDNRSIMHWLLQGEIWVDRNAYLEQFREQLHQFPFPLRERKLLKQFSQFLSCFFQSKEYVQEGHLLDAYNNILEALHHWARIAIVEQGEHPEVMVWEHVRKVNPGIYKLYEELTQSGETLRQRIELVLLACDFSVMSKMEYCCTALLRMIGGREEPWTIAEISDRLADPDINFSLLIDKLVKKSLVREVVVALDKDCSLLEIRYTR